MGFDNIWEHNGLAIAAMGMSIVFIALALISLFIAALPGLLTRLGDVLPPEHAPTQTTDQEVVAAIGFVLHQIELQKPDQS